MTAFVCQSDHFLRTVTNWCEMLNEFSFLMTIWICMHKNSFFVWLLIILWIFSWVFLQVIVFSDFMCSNKFYHLIWNHIWAFIFCSHDIFVMSEHRAFYFITSQSTCLFDQQNCSCWSVAVVLSWDHVH